MTLRLRPLVEADIPFAMTLKDAAGWNQTADDWRRFLGLRPQGCFLAEWGQAPAGTVTTVDHGGRCGWIGMLLVAAELRGLGIGTALLRAAIATLQRDCGAVLLDATPAGRRVYLPVGFRDVDRLQRRVRAGASPTSRPPAPGAISATRVRPVERRDLAAIAALDAPAFGAERTQVLAAWLDAAPQLAWLAESAGSIEGYTLGRRGSRADHIGPLVASSLPAAAALLESALQAAGGGAVLLDTFLGDAGWLRLLDGHGFAVERAFTRMALGNSWPPAPASPRPWLAAGPEVG